MTAMARRFENDLDRVRVVDLSEPSRWRALETQFPTDFPSLIRKETPLHLYRKQVPVRFFNIKFQPTIRLRTHIQ